MLDVVVNNFWWTSLTMTVLSKFTTTVNDQSFSFVNKADVTITPVDGVYKFSDLEVFEGSFLNFKYTANTSDLEQRFIVFK